MSVNLRKLKDQAAEAIVDGKHQDALELLERVLGADPSDHATRQRVGDLQRKLGRDSEAVASYQAVAGGYAAEGRLAKAIAICKLILQIDPRHVETQRTLAELYGRKTGTPAPTPLPSSMAQALQASGTKQAASAIRGRRASKIDIPVLRVGSSPLPGSGDPTAPGPRRSASGSFEIDLDLDLVEAAPAPVAPAVPVVSELDIVEERPAAPAAAVEARDVEIEIDDLLAGEEAVLLDEDLLAASAPLALVVVPAPAGEASADRAPSLAIDPARLPEIPLFGDLPRNAFVDLLQRLTLRSFAAGEVLLRAGELGDSLAIIAVGTVRVEKPRRDAPPVPLARLREGEFFGEMALLGDGRRTADVIAETEGELLEVDKRTLTQIARRFPSVRAVLARFYKQHLLGQLFKTSSLFLPFDPTTRKQLYARFKQLSVARGQVILEEGKKGDGLYVLVSGRCEVSRLEAGLRIELAELGEGDIFGEVSLLTGQPAMATVKALRKSTVLKLPRPTFREVIMTHPQILELVSALSEQRQAMSAEALGAQSSEQVRQWL